jgi:hypothetical protein
MRSSRVPAAPVAAFMGGEDRGRRGPTPPGEVRRPEQSGGRRGAAILARDAKPGAGAHGGGK